MNDSSWLTTTSTAVNNSGGLRPEWGVPTHDHWLQFPQPRREVHYVLGTLLVLVGTTGALGNTLVLFVFTR
jgi:hypothetical protein